MIKAKSLVIIGLALVLGLVVILNSVEKINPINNENVKKFTSEQELKDFLKNNQAQNFYSGGIRETAAPLAQKASTDSGTVSHSTTNVQVQGVDEADIVKNDDKYIYVVSGENLTIINAYPAEKAQISSTINVNGTINEIFVNKNKVVVFGGERYNYPIPLMAEKIAAQGIATPSISRPYYYSQKSFIKVYDVSDKENPKLEKNIVYDGDYYDSRMIDNFVYVIANQPINYQNNDIVLPMIGEKSVQVSDIYYFPIPDYNYRLTTIFALNLDNNELNENSFLTGYSQNLFVSKDNIYLTSPKQVNEFNYRQDLIKNIIIPLVDSSTKAKINGIIDNKNLNEYDKQSKIQDTLENYFNKLDKNEKGSLMKKIEEKTKDYEIEIQKEREKTIIYKISINKDKIEYKAKGEAPGQVLNQFSMDEYKGNFRIATTTGQWQESSLNHVYVLDENLKVIGKLENLAKDEKIYSVRFMEDRAYLVTFKRIDPLFVIDLSNPTDPKVLGELKIPGYSDYLHPYDKDHVIGIGKDVDESIDADKVHTPGAIYYTAIKGIKLSLFDVSDVNNPKEISKYVIGEQGSDSEVLYDHKAFLFDKEKELLVIPISINMQVEYPQPTFEGAYVFSLNLDKGFELKGKISHSLYPGIEDRYYYNYNSKIRRSLYINNVLYTVSGKEVKANDLSDLKEIKEIKLPYQEVYPDYIY